jgi:membrane protein
VLGYSRVPIGWGELLKRTWNAFNKDDVLGLAAELAYSFFFSLFPALIFLVALASYFSLQGLTDQLVSWWGTVMPRPLIDLITHQLGQISNTGNTGLLTFGILVALFSASSGMAALIDTLNHAYDIQESRSIVKVRLLAVGLTIVLVIFALVSLALIVVSPLVAGRLAGSIGMGHAFAIVRQVVEWPIAFTLVATGVGILYWAAPDAEQTWVWITPGSVVATVLWIVASLGFRLYLDNFGSYNAMYGALTGIMVALLWMYISGVVLLLGAELNAEIERASPHGKAAGERRAGQRRTIGLGALRAREEPQKGAHGEPAAVPVPAAALGPGAASARRLAVHPHPARAPIPAPARATPAKSSFSIGTVVFVGVLLGEIAMTTWSRSRRRSGAQ